MHIYDFKAKDLDEIIDSFIKDKKDKKFVGITASEIKTSLSSKKSEEEINLMIHTISKYNSEIIKKSFLQIEDRGESFETGAFFKEFIKRGKFKKVFQRDSLKKIYLDLKQVWLQYLFSIAALIIAFCTWFYPKNPNQNLLPLENHLTELARKNHIQDSLLNVQNQEIRLLQKTDTIKSNKGK